MPPDSPSTPPSRREHPRTQHGRRRWVVVALLAGAVAVVGALLLPLAPVSVNTPQVQWPQDPAAPESTALPLFAYQPLSFDAEIGCSAVRAAGEADGTVLATQVPGQQVAEGSGLVVRATGGGMQVQMLGETIASSRLPPGECTFQLRGDAQGLTVLRDGEVLGTGPSGKLPDVDALVTGIDRLPTGQQQALSVTMQVDDQFSHSPTPAKLALLAVVLAGIGVSLLALWRLDRMTRGDRLDGAGRRSPGRPSVWARLRYRPKIVDLVVPLAMVAWMLLAPFTDDDGYYSAMARNVGYEGYVANYYQLFNQGFTPFTWFYYLLYAWQRISGMAPVTLRVLALVFGLVTWAAIRFVVRGDRLLPGKLARSGAAGSWVRVALAAAFLAWWLALDMGVRPETVVAMCGALGLALMIAARERGSLLLVGLAAAVAGAGFTVHPTGFTALAPVLIGLPWLWRLLRERAAGTGRLGRPALILAVLAPATLAAVLAFADGSLHDFLRGQELFLATQPQADWFDEYQRYGFLFNSNISMGNYAKRAGVVLALLGLAWFLVLLAASRFGRLRLPHRLPYTGLVLLASFLLLWLTPSKWTHHFGSLAGVGAAFLAAMVVVAPFAARELLGRRPPLPVTLAVAASVVVAFALAGHGANLWPYSWNLGQPAVGQPPELLGVSYDSLLLWLGVLLLTWLLVHLSASTRSDSWRGTGGILLATSISVTVFFTANAGYLLGSFALTAQRTWDEYSLAASSLRDPLAESCAAGSAVQVLDPGSARALQIAPGAERPDDAAAEQEGPAPNDGPAPTGFLRDTGWYGPQPPVYWPAQPEGPSFWGSFGAIPGSDRAEAREAEVRTPWRELDPLREQGGALAIQVAGAPAGANQLEVVYGARRPDGTVQVTSRHTVDDANNSPQWRAAVLAEQGELPPEADVVRIHAADRSQDRGGWLAFSTPMVQRWAPISDVVPEQAPVAVGWQHAYIFPCLRKPIVANGIMELPQFGALWGVGPLAGQTEPIWRPDHGGLFGHITRLQSAVELPARVAGAGAPRPIAVYAYHSLLPQGAFTLNLSRETTWGWRAVAPSPTIKAPRVEQGKADG